MTPYEVLAAALVGYLLRWLSEPRRVPTVRVIVPAGQSCVVRPQGGTQVVPVSEAPPGHGWN